MNELSLQSNWGSVGDVQGVAKGYIGDDLSNWQSPDYWYNPGLYVPLIKEYYPVYYSNWVATSKIDTAFKLVKMMIDKKFITVNKVDEFIELCNSISNLLP